MKIGSSFLHPKLGSLDHANAKPIILFCDDILEGLVASEAFRIPQMTFYDDVVQSFMTLSSILAEEQIGTF